MKSTIFWYSEFWRIAPPPLHILSTPNVESLAQASKISEPHHRAEWVWLSVQFVWPTAGLCECCPRAAVGLHCPHLSLSRPASSLLLCTTAGSATEHSVDVERDITGCNSPTPNSKVTLRLMSVAMSAGYMLGHQTLGPMDKRYTSRDEVGFVFWMEFFQAAPTKIKKKNTFISPIWMALRPLARQSMTAS